MNKDLEIIEEAKEIAELLIIQELRLYHEITKDLVYEQREQVLLERIKALEQKFIDGWSNRLHTTKLRSLKRRFKYTKGDHVAERPTPFARY